VLLPLILFAVGLGLLIKGGDWFVDGSVKIAQRFNVPQLLIGATVVSIGTTLPEVMVSATSALGGQGEIAYGNAIGSIICNTSLIAAITLIAKPAKADRNGLITPVIFFFLSAMFYSYIAYSSGYFSRSVGVILLLVFAFYIAVNIIKVKKTSLSSGSISKTKASISKDIVLLILGAVVIAVGARLVVDNGTIIANLLGVPQSVIALTFVALGTSLPELVTAITSLIKGHGAISIGNVIGANLFNLVFVSGISVLLSPFEIPQSSTLFGKNASLILDIPVMFAVMLILTVPAVIWQRLSRIQGVLLMGIYALFCIVQFTM